MLTRHRPKMVDFEYKTTPSPRRGVIPFLGESAHVAIMVHGEEIPVFRVTQDRACGMDIKEDFGPLHTVKGIESMKRRVQQKQLGGCRARIPALENRL